jgi:hypothetical protein
MSWAEALKEYAKGTGKFVVPKKGTPEYEAVAKIHRKLKGVPEPAPEKPSRRTKKAAVAPEEDAPIPPNKVEEKKAALAKLHEQGIAEKKAAKAESRAANRKAVVEEKKVLAEKEEKYAKLEAEMAEIKKMLGHKERSPAVVKKIEEKLATPVPQVAARQERIAKSAATRDAKKTARAAAKPSFKVEEKPIVLTFSD